MVGVVLVVLLLALYALALRSILRAPFRAFAVLVAGMAFHNFGLMILLRLGTPGILVRAIQLWKEGILLLLAAMVAQRAWQWWREGKRPQLSSLDWVAAAFAAMLLLYLLMPARILHGEGSLTRRLVEFRQLAQLPLLYAYGRIFWPARREDLSWAFQLILGAAGLVGLFGVIELFFIPTTTWLSWGVNLLSDWLHYAYGGPQHIPDYFFQTTSGGLFLRRMVSTYVSPLGIAYTGLLVVPIATVLYDARGTRIPAWFRGATIGLLFTAILLSVTRLAIGLLVVEMVLLLILRRRRWLWIGVPVVGVLALVALFEYVHFGPLVGRDLRPVSARPTVLTVVQGSATDPSLRGHLATLKTDIGYALKHPLGTGLGSSIHQFGSSGGRGESAIFDIFDDAGLITGLLYLALYALAVYQGGRAWLKLRADPLLAALPLVASVGGLVLAPIALTSEINGDFSVVFLFWWAAGFAVSARRLRPPRAAVEGLAAA
jgi:hypothetical protein